jgi:tetratricopeptide (TPR) repeat protein
MFFNLLSLVSCSFLGGKTSFNREVEITSFPGGAEVAYFDTQTKKFRSLGQTPLVVDEKTINEWLASKQEFVGFKISKSGHIQENIFIDIKKRHKLAYQVDLKPVDIWHDKEREISSTAANRLAQRVQAINKKLLTKNFQAALSDTEILIEQFPKAHVFYDIKGSLLLLMGKEKESLASYQQSLKLNPDNLEAKTMVDKLKGGAR